jgi:transcriptional regulator with XRE-family HTH domain
VKYTGTTDHGYLKLPSYRAVMPEIIETEPRSKPLAFAAGALIGTLRLSHFEAGARKPSFENLKRLAGALDVSTDYLLGRADTPNADGTVGRLHRDIHNLSHDDMKLAEDFVGMLLKRANKKDDS